MIALHGYDSHDQKCADLVWTRGAERSIFLYVSHWSCIWSLLIFSNPKPRTKCDVSSLCLNRSNTRHPGLFWRCPEVVRIDNSQAWRAMSQVLTTIPRVVHPDDVYSGVVHVAGRDLHYVCGMCAHENVEGRHAKDKKGPWGFTVKKLIREEEGAQVKDGFCMYPEERLGMQINSASIMWEMVEEVFHGVRTVMRDKGRARSGSFSMVWSSALQEFWKVCSKRIVFFL